MRRCALGLLLLAGCAAQGAIRPGTALGRVVVYKNGVAYFQRSAVVDDDVLHLLVPEAQMDDFLESLTVVDERTGAPAPVAYHRAPGGEGMIDLEVQLGGPRPHRLELSYITEAPSWKPTYRAVLGARGRVGFEGWAVVDNDSGEDWQRVKVGVGSSSALSFRFDLQSRQEVKREQLSAGDRFATAPPMGEAPYGGEPAQAQRVVGELAEGAIPRREDPAAQKAAAAKVDPEVVIAQIGSSVAVVGRQSETARAQRDVVKISCLQDKANKLEAVLKAARERRAAVDAPGDPAEIERARLELGMLRQRGVQLMAEANQCVGHESEFIGENQVLATVSPDIPPDDPADAFARAARVPHDEKPPAPPEGIRIGAREHPPERPPARTTPVNVPAIVAELRAHPGPAVVEGYAAPGDADPQAASLDRATRARDALVAEGIPSDRLSAVARGLVAGRSGVRVVRAPEPPRGAGAAAAAQAVAEPIGASRFESPSVISVPRGASALVSIVKAETDGEVVYLYDPETARGNQTFPFRALRLVNPTDSTLESGPVTVFGDGSFVGEGLCEPIPARSAGFVPFALDRQVVADVRATESEGGARLVRADRGALVIEVEHTRHTRVTLHNRLREPARVFVRHTVPPGYDLRAAPEARERVGGAYLFPASVPAQGKADVDVEEAIAVVQTCDVWSPGGLDAVRALLASGGAGQAQPKLAEMVKMADEARAIEQKLAAAREQIADDRRREGLLGAQVAALRAARTSGPLLAPLERKLREQGARLSASTLEVVALEERLSVIRAQVADASHDLRYERP